MKVAPGLLFAILAALGVAGCRTAGVDSIAHSRPPEVRPRSSFDLQEYIADHNENAERIQSVKARPAITVTMGPQGETKSGQVDAHLALERPRNFKLELAHLRSTVADIGSNDEKFWFWFQNKKDRSVYYCNYDELKSTSLAVTYQPDWIVEAMGLKVITPGEAAQIRVRAGSQAGTTVLTFPPTKSSGQTYSRVMIVSDLTRRMQEFRVLADDGKTLIAQASVKKYQTLPATKGTSGVADGQGNAPESCTLPESVVLEWKRELLTLDVALRDVKVNQFDPALRASLFVEPTPSGYARVNLAEVARPKASESSTAVRETLPIPQSRNRTQTIPPLQIQGSAAAAKTSRRPAPAATASAMLLPVLDLDVVDAPVPTAPGSRAESLSGTAMATSPTTNMER